MASSDTAISGGDNGGNRTVYAYPDILNGINQCLMDANYPDFMALPNNVEKYLFTSMKACCDENEYTVCITAEPTSAPSLSPTTRSPTFQPTDVPTETIQVVEISPPASADETASRDGGAIEKGGDVPTLSPTLLSTLHNDTSNTTSMNSYIVHSTSQTHESPDDASLNPLIAVYVLVPLVALVVASVFYGMKRKKEKEAAESKIEDQSSTGPFPITDGIDGRPHYADEEEQLSYADTNIPSVATDGGILENPTVNNAHLYEAGMSNSQELEEDKNQRSYQYTRSRHRRHLSPSRRAGSRSRKHSKGRKVRKASRNHNSPNTHLSSVNEIHHINSRGGYAYTIEVDDGTAMAYDCAVNVPTEV
mmetsp:Transcript_28899/g.61026  ORF Transcript_28899/g.61026 Transcript_28899/m.61026 type:complete len:363 (+) Transcript_28899:126-1214(+)|eukprot:CAMPEP_0183734392 /NCGR_PEP_ID=MMETSP0737-20130205/43685_1 /TAXON_ID=385413 /ORGANISM="Thalassiosira miniscula, Strain CCMP1093" /LENGTH=362 /DNA_ID=CAMNT_0025967863 /DNA_START=106 /DNA_END=1194 /DNA_ORIENTATION=-